VQRCLDFLSDSYRAVILLHEAHSLTAPEIAELLGESVGTIKIRLHRARRKLQEIMEIGCAVSQGKDGVPCCEPKLLGVEESEKSQPETRPQVNQEKHM
jgi:RNA polymerase sigma-70 factor (ECF subfamily)